MALDAAPKDEVVLGVNLPANGTGPEFYVKTRDPHAGAKRPLEGMLSVVGTLNGATFALEVRTLGAWRDWGEISGGAALPFVGTLSMGADADDVKGSAAPVADRYRFKVTGGGGSTDISASFVPVGIVLEVDSA